jgi:regulator of sirC expression with transglutaminase-like and TPR domain
MKRRTLLLSSGAGIFSVPAHPQRIAIASGVDIEALRALLQLADNQIDYAKAKLTIDRMVDPKADIPWALQRLDQMVSEISAMFSGQDFARRTSSAARIEALTAYLYNPGPWNQNRVFRYDLEHDPTGKEIIGNKLLPNYLRSRLGNCVSMPVLFLILSQRLGLDVSLATAPEHAFVKYRDERGTVYNLETTDHAGLKRDASYQKEFEITQEALNNGIYLRALPKREALTVMMGELLEHLARKSDAAGVHAVADLILAQFPKSIDAILHKHHAYIVALKTQYKSKYARFDDIPADKRDDARRLVAAAREWYMKAHALGWRPPSKEFEEAAEQLTRNARKNLQEEK